jgi:signal transduction histidine kinase
MYKENVVLSERLQITLNALEEEKKRRFIAERNAAWKDVAFKAAHKLGNPIDALDTFLQSLNRRLQNNRCDEAIHIASEMESSVEESKTVIAQFKSLTKAQEITLRPVDLLPIIQHTCKTAEENGVIVSVRTIEDCPQVMIDPDRITECFNELVANALHWFNKPDKKIRVDITKPSKKELPETLDKTLGYLKIHFEDNGGGIPLENKEKVFAPFFTTYPHGTGLGLSLVKSIVDGHGGLIYENGRPSEGASFEIFLPIAKKTRSR